MKISKRRAFAASVVVTFAVLPGCGASHEGSCEPPECHANPPPQDLTPVPETTTASSASAATSATVAK
jgi:hypothetical protein